MTTFSVATKKDYELLEAIRMNDKYKVTEALKQGAAPNIYREGDEKTALMVACVIGNEEIVKILLKNRADVNAKNKSEGRTALMTAAKNGYYTIMKILVEFGANVLEKDNKGHSAVVYAFDAGQIYQGKRHVSSKETVQKMIDLLIRKGGYAIKKEINEYIKRFPSMKRFVYGIENEEQNVRRNKIQDE